MQSTSSNLSHIASDSHPDDVVKLLKHRNAFVIAPFGLLQPPLLLPFQVPQVPGKSAPFERLPPVSFEPDKPDNCSLPFTFTPPVAEPVYPDAWMLRHE